MAKFGWPRSFSRDHRIEERVCAPCHRAIVPRGFPRVAGLGPWAVHVDDGRLASWQVGRFGRRQTRRRDVDECDLEPRPSTSTSMTLATAVWQGAAPRVPHLEVSLGPSYRHHDELGGHLQAGAISIVARSPRHVHRHRGELVAIGKPARRRSRPAPSRRANRWLTSAPIP